MKTGLLRLLLSLLTLGYGSFAFANNLVINGSFESPSVGSSYSYLSGTFGNWTFAGSSGVSGNGSNWQFASAPDGTQEAFLQNTASISQDISGLTIGQTYTLSFYLDARNSSLYTPNPVTVRIGGDVLGSITHSDYAWSQYTESFTADASTMTLVFQTSSTGGDADAGVDAVSIAPIPTSTPEPGSLVLLASGLLGLSQLRRRS